jgi:hypothetical protein
MKYITIIFLIVICSCEHPVAKPVILKPVQHKVVETEKPFSNPSIIFGSSYAQFFQCLHRNNQFEKMICFTSNSTIKKFSREQVLNYYKHNFKFDYVLGTLSNINVEEGVTILTYSKASIFATRRKLRIPCILENDSVKIILNSLSAKPFE